MNTVISQALATGLPVIATRHSGLPDQVKDGSNGFLVEEGDCQALAEKILHFMEHPDGWAAMSRSAREHVSQRYDCRTLMKAQVDWYRKLMSVD
jgi:colanic acid/amylovoran biosynthesis glycosyltransferase